MIAGILSFATSKLGIALIAGGVVLVALLWFYVDAKAAGAAAALATAAAAQAARVQAANRARNQVDQSDEAIRADKHNRDNW